MELSAAHVTVQLPAAVSCPEQEEQEEEEEGGEQCNNCKASADGMTRMTEIRQFKTYAGWYQGRVEVKHEGQWGTVCRHGFGHQSARVFCKSIGGTQRKGYRYT